MRSKVFGCPHLAPLRWKGVIGALTVWHPAPLLRVGVTQTKCLHLLVGHDMCLRAVPMMAVLAGYRVEVDLEDNGTSDLL